MTARYWLRHCGGYNPRTRRNVGERHRWSGDGWGKGSCIWCHRDLDQLRYRAEVKPRDGSERHLAEALRRAA